MSGNKIKILAVLGLLIVAIFAMVPNASATKELRITDYNLEVLRNKAAWTPYSYGQLMLWPNSLDAKYQYKKMVGSISAVTVNDNYNSNGLLGECVSLAKALSKNNVQTKYWKSGVTLFTYNLIAPGTVIATFGGSGGGYYGHTAIFTGEYTYSNGKRDGIMVWDQNYLPNKFGVIARHSIKAKGTTYPTDVNNANNYYTVVVP